MPNKTSHHRDQGSQNTRSNDVLGDDLVEAIRNIVANISKSFIVEWYTSISPTNHDFVASCETLIEGALTKLAELCVKRLDKYKVGQLVTSLLHDHVLNEDIEEKIQSIESQIDNHEYDICQSSVVRLFGLLCTEELRRVIFTQDFNRPPKSQKQDCKQGSFKRSKPLEDHQHSSEDSAPTTSALYTLVIAMLTKAVFMPIVDSISAPNWLYAVIIWLCKNEERERAARESAESNRASSRGVGRNPDLQFMNPNISVTQHSNLNMATRTRSYRTLDLEEGIALSSINFDNPVCDSLKRPLDNIEIYSTEEVKSTNSNYILYCIAYDGLCHRHPSAGNFQFIPENLEMPIIDKRATHATGRRFATKKPSPSPSTPTSSDMSNRKSFHRRMTIKRRFREFVILQLRLEENPKIRPYMKNIPKPTKLKAATQSIFSLPGINNIKLDQSTIKLRQRFLERFLIALNSSPFIANSYEFKEFFSYNVNSATNISKSKSLILQVNLNKVFVDSVRSALSIIRSTLPGDEYQHLGSQSNPDPDAWMVELQQSTMKLHVQTRTSHSKMNLERYIDSKLTSMNGSPTLSNDRCGLNRFEHLDIYESSGYQGSSLRSNTIASQSTSSNTNSSSLLLSRSSSSESKPTDSSSRSSSTESIYYDASNTIRNHNDKCNSIQICDSVPIATKIIDIIHYSISRNSACSTSSINLAMRLMLGKMIERYAIKLLEAAFTLESATFCINGITSSIWDESNDPPLDMENASLDEAVLHLTNLLQNSYAGYNFIPKQFINSMLSKQIRFYLSQLASQRRNKFVIYSFFVHLLDELETVEQ